MALGAAHRWNALLESAQFPSIEALAAAVNLDSSYVGHILRLTLLAPDIITAILEGQATGTIGPVIGQADEDATAGLD